MHHSSQSLSIIVPCYNESTNVIPFYSQLQPVLAKIRRKGITCELLYVNDGSTDATLIQLSRIAKDDKSVKIIDLSRNFGKEIAMSAGIHYATGEALLMIDGDGQYPPELIPEFIKKWQAGAQVVTGIRDSNQGEGLVKRYGSKLFYWAFNRFTGSKLIPQSTDFRLIDRAVQKEFTKLTERNRVTRGLIDWLGFRQDYIHFDANARLSGDAGYSVAKLLRLALDSSVSLSLTPLYFSAYAGAVILPLSVLLGVFSATEMVIGDPLGLKITGSAYLVILILFLVGLLLISQGIMALYLSHMHTESQNRPLFILNQATSRGLDSPDKK
jgi:polyisoprenyl-phosphate glycosyltransferase